jgi:hypothetical protein
MLHVWPQFDLIAEQGHLHIEHPWDLRMTRRIPKALLLGRCIADSGAGDSLTKLDMPSVSCYAVQSRIGFE